MTRLDQGPLPKPADQMTTSELLGHFHRTFAIATSDEVEKRVRTAATTAYKQVLAELAKRIDAK